VNKLLPILACLLLNACASISTDRSTISQYNFQSLKNTQPKIKAKIQVYVPSTIQSETFTLNTASQQLLISPGLDLKEAAVDISKYYFEEVDQLSFTKKADFILKVYADSYFSHNNKSTAKGVLTAELLSMDGHLLFSKQLSNVQTRRDVDQHIYYGIYTKTLSDFFESLMQQKGKMLKQYVVNNESQKAQINTLLENNILDLASTGSGFFINETGHVVTNQHVIEQCVAITVGVGGKLITSNTLMVDKKRDIAVLDTHLHAEHYAIFNETLVGERLGEHILTLGYPLHGVLSTSVNLTTGNISSLLGVKDDENVYQITAPIQAGNSGGPVINQKGLVAGVVQSKLNALELSAQMGDLAQNVNFAIKSNQIKDFLGSNKIKYHTKSYKSAPMMSTVDIADKAKSYTVQIKCHG
jgi:S1-C subfamily serine protease